VQHGGRQLAPHYWVGNRVFTPQAAVDAETRPAVARATAHVEPLERGEEGILASWRQWLPLASLAALLFLCGYLWGGLRSDWERRMIAEGAVAHYGLWKIERPGLEEVLGIINKELGTVDADVEQLAGDHAKLAGDNAAEARKSWNAVRERLRESRRLLGQAGSVYGLSPDERAIVEAMIRRKLADVAGISIVEKEAAGRDEKRADDAGKKDDVPPKDVQTPQKKTGDKKPAAADDSAEKAGKSRSGKEESKASSSKK
jgi:hypothetical protein